jgi:hypothetical protein
VASAQQWQCGIPGPNARKYQVPFVSDPPNIAPSDRFLIVGAAAWPGWTRVRDQNNVLWDVYHTLLVACDSAQPLPTQQAALTDAPVGAPIGDWSPSSSGSSGSNSRWESDDESVTECGGRSFDGTEAIARLVLSSFQGMWMGRTYGCTYMNPTRPAYPPYQAGDLSDHASGAAFDAMLPKIGDPIGQRLANWYVEHFDELGIKYVIYNHRIYEGTEWSDYHGSNPHEDHVHLSLLKKAAKGLTEADILPALRAGGYAPGTNTARGPPAVPHGSRIVPRVPVRSSRRRRS